MADTSGAQILYVSEFTNNSRRVKCRFLFPTAFSPSGIPPKTTQTEMNIVMIIIGIIVGGGLGIWGATTVMRNKLLAKSQEVLKDAEEKGEVLKKAGEQTQQ